MENINTPPTNQPVRVKAFSLFRILVLITSAVVLLVAGVAYGVYISKNSASVIKPESISPVSNKAKDFPLNSQAPIQVADPELMPDLIPINFTKDTESRVLKNYNLTKKDGGKESYRMYIGNRKIEDLRLYFLEYFTQNGWKMILDKNDQQTNKILIAEKDLININININSNLENEEAIVTVIASQKARAVPEYLKNDL